jgi:hypothetical protein
MYSKVLSWNGSRQGWRTRGMVQTFLRDID